MKIVFRVFATWFCLVGLKLNAGNLKVNLAPAQAVSAGAQWQVDGGTWRSSGTTVSGLSNATHTLDFKTISGWIAPTAMSVAVVNGTTTLTETYVQAAGLKITLTPSSGQWRIDGGAWKTSGITVTGLAPGSHTIDYASVSGYAVPAIETVTLVAGQTTTLARSYTQLAQLKVTLSPTTAQWRVDGGAWQASGATVANLAVGAHTVDYAALSGYNPPPSESVSLASGQLLSLNRSYVQLGRVTVTLSPTSGQWQLDDGAWTSSGATVSNVTPGAHTVRYSTLTGWASPATETVTLAAGQTLSFARSYTHFAQLSISLVPSAGQWRANGGSWQSSGASLLVPAGVYTIEYSTLAFYDSPATETITLAPSGIFSTTRTYLSQKPSLRINVGAGGQWRIDGGAWLNSGAQVTGLNTGSHTVDYTDVGGIYDPLPPETISLALRDNITLDRVYPFKASSLQVNLTPSTATWRAYQNEYSSGWQLSGATITGLHYSSYNIEYSQVVNYDPLATENVALSPAQSLTINRSYTPQAQLTVNLDNPSGQWNIDGGPWQSSGATVGNLGAGLHPVTYSPVAGYTAPPDETVELTPSQSFTIDRSYTPNPAQLSITLNLPEASWRIDGGAWQASGAVVSNITPGPHMVDYSDVAGYTHPPSESMPLAPGDSLALTHDYTAIPPATVAITIDPPSAQWNLNNGPWQASGATLANVPAGLYSIYYLPVSGYVTSSNESITVGGGQTLSLTRRYTRITSLTITLSQTGGQWRVDGGTWRNSGSSYSGIPVGTHTVEYSAVNLYAAPPTETITVATEDQLAFMRTYTPLTQISMLLSHVSGQWRIDGGAWLPSGFAITNAGSHTLDFKPVAGYVTPPSQTVTVIQDQTLQLSVTYDQLPQLTFILHPDNAQWRVDGGAWLASGATVSNLSVGTHAIDYSAIPHFAAPASNTYTLVGGQSLTVNRFYLPLASLTLTISYPTTAQWRVDGGAWRASGTTASDLAFDTPHTVEYFPVFNYETPAAETFTLASGQAFTATRFYNPLSQMTVTLSPATAQWRVDGGAWQASGASVGNLSYSTPHVVDYSAIAGYITPPSETINLVSGLNPLTRTYTPLASFHVDLNSPFFQWRLDGGPWQFTSATLNNLALGDHLVDFAPYPGYIAPASETVTLVSGVNPTLTRTYTPLASFHVDLNSPFFQWRLDGGPWQFTSATLNNLALGDHLVDFAPYPGYIAPPSETVTLVSGVNPTLTRTYTPLASFHVDLNSPFFQWRLDGGPWQFTSATLNNLALGDHLVDFAHYPGYIAPPSETVTLVSGVNPTLTRTYTPLASFHVDLNSPFFQWRLDGGPWQFTSATLNNLALGDHLVDFAPYPGYVAPLSETVTLVSGVNPTLVREYVPIDAASLAVTLVPSTGEWRIDGGAWRPSGALVANLMPGSHTIDFSPVTGYVAPAPQTLTLEPNGNASYTFTYAVDTPAYVVIKNFFDAGSNATIIAGRDGVFYGFSNAEGANGAGVLFRINADGSGFALLKTLGYSNDGNGPTSLVESSDGSLYGTTNNGGSANTGTVFKVNKDGTGYTTLRMFVTPSMGINPNSLIEGSDGWLYGTTTKGGAQNEGLIFKMSRDGSTYTTMKHFTGGSDGKTVVGVIEGPDGLLYGTAAAGGSGFGTVFRLNNQGGAFTILKTFAGAADGATPRASLLFGTDGLLYGTTLAGGASNRGTLFRLNPDGTGQTILKNFAGTAMESGAPTGQLQEDAAGNLYGIATTLGPGGRGSVFTIKKDGSGFAVVKTFTGGATDGGFVGTQNTPIAISNGVIHGVTRSGGAGNHGTIFAVNTDGSGFMPQKSLGAPDGSMLMTSLAEGRDGVLYGASYIGGSLDSGVLYKVNKDGSGFAVLRNLAVNGDANFNQGVIEASDGALYGIAAGALFRLNKDGTGYTVVRSFVAEASSPAAVIEGTDGTLYGTTAGGGTAGIGTIFKINRDGSGYTALHSFAGGLTDGKWPSSTLTEGRNGMLYGVTNAGGNSGNGIIFAVNKDGTGYAVIKHFVGGADGAVPYAGVVQGSDNLLYGTTTAGGSSNQGVVFKLATDGSNYAVLQNFVMPSPDTQNLTYAGVVEKNGTLYGVTYFGGTLNGGTVFSLKTDGSSYTTLVNFGAGDTDGSVPAASLLIATDGNLYGTTARGGSGATIYRLHPD